MANFFRRIRKSIKKVGRVVGRVGPVALPIIGGLAGGPAGSLAGGAAGAGTAFIGTGGKRKSIRRKSLRAAAITTGATFATTGVLALARGTGFTGSPLKGILGSRTPSIKMAPQAGPTATTADADSAYATYQAGQRARAAAGMTSSILPGESGGIPGNVSPGSAGGAGGGGAGVGGINVADFFGSVFGSPQASGEAAGQQTSSTGVGRTSSENEGDAGRSPRRRRAMRAGAGAGMKGFFSRENAPMLVTVGLAVGAGFLLLKAS